ncbi:unnamed protein product [Arabis nemorensis]|uniref:Endonuclease/exonuclease/phosphatase domain-containing protein n=1 Tax=Arabis nemorensis TaxID=586526 RepID=A0A565BYD8_9BRAS|nr:unnamed protein product [Arabis nemorensis]
MKCFSWNVRGLNSDARKLSIKRWITTNRPIIGGLLETRVQQQNLVSMISQIAPGWRFTTNHSLEADNGRIVIIWEPFLSVVVYLKTSQLVLCGVHNPTTNKAFTVAFLYAKNRTVERVPLWNLLKELAASSLLQNSPWIIMGDFNQVISLSEVYSLLPATVCMQGMTDLQECLSSSGLFDLSPKGCFFTWTNKSSTNPKARKLDRVLVNEKWQDIYPDSNAFFDVPGGSDHSPALVTLENGLGTRKSRFNFFTFYTSHPQYSHLMEVAWNCQIIASSPMFSLYQKLRSAKLCCKGLNQRSFSNIQSRTKLAFEKLENIQRQVLINPSQSLFEEERVARDDWLLFSLAEESFFHQKSRIRWLSMGDANTRFFYRVVQANLSRNIIHFLRDEAGLKITDPVLIKGMASQFYLDLLGTANDFVASGRRCLFWHDNWTTLGPLIDITSSNGPRVTGISSASSVFQALETDSWLRSRGRHPILVLLRSCIPTTPLFSTEDDLYL